MSNILKRYNEINAVLVQAVENGMTVVEAYPALQALMSASRVGNGGTVLRNAHGTVTHVKCAYHKKWEPVAPLGTSDDDIDALELVKFGAKAGASHGYAHACMVGINAHGKQTRDAKRAESELMAALLDNELSIEEANSAKADIEAARTAITPRADGRGSDDAETAKSLWEGDEEFDTEDD